MRSLRTWAGIHRWTSIISTLFLLILSLTGLPLIFQKEIDEAFGSSGMLAEVPESKGVPTLDSIVSAARARHPGDTMISLEFAKRWPIVETRSAPTPDAGPTRIHREVIDLRTGQLTTMPQRRSPVMQFLHTLHADLYLGLPGGLFLAGMALVVIASVVSGLILYPPFVRRFGFGTVRMNKSRKLLWLDLHNLTGIITMAWLLLVATTGAINTLHGPVSTSVRTAMSDEIRRRVVVTPAGQMEEVDRPGSIEAAIAAARGKVPAARVMSLLFPNAEISPSNHYVVLMKDGQMMTQELFYAVLIDAHTGGVSDVFEPTGVTKALLIAEPLHFPTTFPGLAPKLVWSFFDIVTIMVLVSGLYLWASKPGGRIQRKRPAK
jgi:uncharacterized iron-regulated membrane protein